MCDKINLSIYQEFYPVNNFERAVFVDFVARNLFDSAGAKDIKSASFLEFGYHKNKTVSAPENYTVGYDLAPGVDDDGKTARQNLLNTVVPLIEQGLTTGQNACLFCFNIDEDNGYPQGVRENSISSMSNPLPHVFEMMLYESTPDGYQVSKSKTTKLKVVLYDNTGMPITLAHMLNQTTLVPPAPPVATAGTPKGP